jgi:hypothetical protein
MLYLRPHHIRAFKNFNTLKKYGLSDDEFVKDFCLRNVKMAHNRKFIIYWRRFLENLRANPDRTIVCSRKEDIVCKNCDIRHKCIEKGTELHDIAKKVDQKAEKELNIKEGDILKTSDFM